MAEGNARQPVDTDVDIGRRLLASGNVEVAAARRAGADEHRIETFAEKGLEAVDAAAAPELDAEVEDIADLLIKHGVRQPEFRDLRPHHAAGARILIEHHDVIAERGEIAGNRQRGRAGADECDPLVVPGGRRFRQPRTNVVLEVGRDTLEPADRDRLVLDAHAPTSRLAGTITGAPEDPREHVRLPIDHVRVAVATRGDQPDVFRNRCMCRTGPLAVHDLVEIVRDRDISEFHSPPRPRAPYEVLKDRVA